MRTSPNDPPPPFPFPVGSFRFWSGALGAHSGGPVRDLHPVPVFSPQPLELRRGALEP